MVCRPFHNGTVTHIDKSAVRHAEAFEDIARIALNSRLNTSPHDIWFAEGGHDASIPLVATM